MTAISDNFNAADANLNVAGTQLTWSMLSSTWTVATNGVGKTAAVDTFNFARAEHDLASSNTYAQVVALTNNATAAFGPACRMNSSNDDCYFFYHYSGAIFVYKRVSSVDTQIATVANTLATNDVLKIEANGSTIKTYVNGVEKTSTTDTSISAGVRVGLFQYASLAPTMDDFAASDLVAAVGSRAPARKWMLKTLLRM